MCGSNPTSGTKKNFPKFPEKKSGVPLSAKIVHIFAQKLIYFCYCHLVNNFIFDKISFTMDEKGKKLVKLKDFHNTIILIDENADTDQSVKKYMKDLRDYKYTSIKDLTKEQNKNFKD